MEPVLIRIGRDHAYKNRGKGKNGCGAVFNGVTCMAAKTHPMHIGVPMSLNEFISQSNRFAYEAQKKAWSAIVTDELIAAGLPVGWESVYETKVVYDRKLKQKVERPVEVGRRQISPDALTMVSMQTRVCFPTRPDLGRDQGNYRWFVEKVVGDVLVTGGWLKDDTVYPERHFEHDALDVEVQPNQAWTEMMLLAS